ncbi:MAG TPA: multicopper oxidase domain-containing protein [Gemmatimonadales bacterium]
MFLILTAALLAADPGVPAERIVPNDNTRPAGRLRGGVLTLALELREGRWFPDGERGRFEVIHAFAEAGKPLSVPGPLVRVPEGTAIRISIRNTLDSTLVLYGMHARPGSAADTVQVAPHATREVAFTAGRPGTYYYWGSTTGASLEKRAWLDSQLSGGFVVDPAGASASDRVFVIGMWHKPFADSGDTGERKYEDLMVINGVQWPHTERIRHAAGDSVRWRWINATESSHPMHLHGFYFRLDAQGDWTRDTAFAPDRRREVVTQLMQPGATMSIAWRAAREGNWVFHCHFSYHVSHWLTTVEPDTLHGMDHRHRMSGLVLGLHVDPGKQASERAERPARRLRLVLQEAPGRFDSVPGFGFVLQEGAGPDTLPSADLPRSGPTLLLERGEPVAITVVNRLRQPSAVHWHGIELESFPDGIPGWSGTPGRIMPPIMPGDSFVAEFVPPRSGTFMYHAHSNEDAQISSGLYGTLIVRDGAAPLPATDLAFLLGASGPFPNRGTLNGELEPDPLELEAGRTYRIRLVHIQPDWRANFRIFDGRGGITEWVPVAKDGAELPAAERVAVPAALQAGPGETADFAFTPREPGRYRLEVTTPSTGWHVLQELHVR